MSDEAEFWMVWNPNGNTPRYTHQSYESAVTEAQRLARVVEGEQFYVLHAVAKAMIPRKPVEVHLLLKQITPSQASDDQIPF